MRSMLSMLLPNSGNPMGGIQKGSSSSVIGSSATLPENRTDLAYIGGVRNNQGDIRALEDEIIRLMGLPSSPGISRKIQQLQAKIDLINKRREESKIGGVYSSQGKLPPQMGARSMGRRFGG